LPRAATTTRGSSNATCARWSFPYVESSDTFTIRATGDWQISDTPDSREWTNAYGWVHVDQLSGKGDPGTYQKVTVTCDQNTSEERNATIYLHGCGEENVAIAIRQDNGIFEWKPFDNGQQFDVSGMLKLNAEAGPSSASPTSRRSARKNTPSR